MGARLRWDGASGRAPAGRDDAALEVGVGCSDSMNTNPLSVFTKPASDLRIRNTGELIIIALSQKKGNPDAGANGWFGLAVKTATLAAATPCVPPTGPDDLELAEGGKRSR